MTDPADPTAHGAYPATQRPDEARWRADLDAYFGASSGSAYDKLATFARYVPRQTLTRFLARYEVFKLALPVPGIMVEAGVLLGQGLFTWAQLSAIFEPLNHTGKIVGFDLFPDDGPVKELTDGAALYDRNRWIGHIPRIELVRGDLRKTAAAYIDAHPETVVRLLNLDCNTYEATAAALDAFYPRMPKGAVVVFDEINAPSCPGETRAVMERIGLGKLSLRRHPWDSFLSWGVVE
ncbi:MAG: class I SAM-dependent methyltransferase [Nitrospinae bacterium]|nr:class I SAM-dependent methyltransferase [Nitrospinota bacterium]